jgi:hypothetical protein
MTTWEYAFLHYACLHHTNKYGWVVEEDAGIRLLDDVTLLGAFNTVGAEGWLVQTPYGPFGSPRADAVKTLIGGTSETMGGSTYIMRRSRD